MMMVAAVLLFTADRSCCWLPAGNDGAWAEPRPAHGKGLQTPCTSADLMPLWAGNGCLCSSAPELLAE